MVRESFVTCGAYALFMQQAGQGKPVIILEAGAGDDSTTWKDIFLSIAQFSHVMAYDRAGLGRSEKPATPRSALQLVSDLHSLLQAARLEGPFASNLVEKN